MKKVISVIGMNYGDEGKGHITNYFSDKNTLVVRYNGGAQAAHTVCLSDGSFHVFHQFGSGTLSGARTLLASHFILNPLFLVAEWESLHSKNIPLREVFVDPRCRVSTPFDMIINQFNSYKKGSNDTTGFGINETVERSQFKQLCISMIDLISKNEIELVSILNRIKNEYVPWRIEKLGHSFKDFDEYVTDHTGMKLDNMIEPYLDVIKNMFKIVYVWADDDIIYRFLNKGDDFKIVFEGGQGLLLDQSRKKDMPYLTRSSTGMRNILYTLRKVNHDIDLEVCLVSRAYLTRHGDGPVWNEVSLPYKKVEDPINIKNEYQGSMRYGYLKQEWYNEAIDEVDFYINNHTTTNIKQHEIKVAMTCMDHLNTNILNYSHGSELINGTIDDFIYIKLLSSGPTEKDIKEI